MKWISLNKDEQLNSNNSLQNFLNIQKIYILDNKELVHIKGGDGEHTVDQDATLE